MGSFAVEGYGLDGLLRLKKTDITKRIKQYEKMIQFWRVIDDNNFEAPKIPVKLPDKPVTYLFSPEALETVDFLI